MLNIEVHLVKDDGLVISNANAITVVKSSVHGKDVSYSVFMVCANGTTQKIKEYKEYPDQKVSAFTRANKYAEYLAAKYRDRVYHINVTGSQVETEDSDCDVSSASDKSKEQPKERSASHAPKSME